MTLIMITTLGDAAFQFVHGGLGMGAHRASFI